MMDFARVRPAAQSAVNINAVIETSLRLASFDKSFQNLRLKKLLSTNLPEISADNDQLQQVFLNLFLNARDAMPGGGELLIKTSKSNNEIVIEIADSGAGIDPKNIKQIFDPFFTTKQTGKGTGLAWRSVRNCHRARRQNRSFIERKNGTTFFVVLPVNRKSDAATIRR
jgi:signal transduction histidine kinase